MNVQSEKFLSHTLIRLLPEVFLHPVWIQFARNISDTPPGFLQSLLHKLQQENLDDPAIQCQVLFMCAYLQSHLNEHAEAEISLYKISNLAETHNLSHITLWSTWGKCAISIRMGNLQQAVECLDSLQEKVKSSHDWVLFSILDLFRQNLELEAKAPDRELLDWLFCWGELPLLENTHGRQNDPRAFAVPITGSDSRWLRGWKSIREWFRTTIGNGQSPQASAHRDMLRPIPNNESVGSAPGGFQPVTRTAQTTILLTEETEKTAQTPDPSPPTIAPQSPALPRTFQVLQDQPRLTMAVYCLGQFQVYQGEQQVENWSSRKSLSVFKYLILEHPTPVVKEVLMDKFWPDSDLEAARRNLHQAIYSLRQTFRGDNQEFHHIWFKNDCYSLNPSVEIWIDFREFVKCIEVGRRLDREGRFEEAIETYGTAEGLYQGDFLEEELYEDWTVPQRDQFLNLYVGAVDRLCELYLEKHQYTAVIQLCHKLLAKDSCHESAHRTLMQCYLAQGQRNLAVRQYQTCVKSLQQDLNILPSEETTALYRRIASRRNG